jgi:hypothetical protein
MLNLNDPRTTIIFKASSYLDRLKIACRVFILQPFSERQSTFENMKKVCEEFLLFAQEHYPEQIEKISTLTHQLMDEIDKLALINKTSEKGNCTVCNHVLQTRYSGVKEFGNITTCSHCPTPIIHLLNELEYPTGVWSI